MENLISNSNRSFCLAINLRFKTISFECFFRSSPVWTLNSSADNRQTLPHTSTRLNIHYSQTISLQYWKHLLCSDWKIFFILPFCRLIKQRSHSISWEKIYLEEISQRLYISFVGLCIRCLGSSKPQDLWEQVSGFVLWLEANFRETWEKSQSGIRGLRRLVKCVWDVTSQ